MKAVRSFGTSGINNPSTQRNKPEDLKPQHQRCGNPKFRTFLFHSCHSPPLEKESQLCYSYLHSAHKQQYDLKFFTPPKIKVPRIDIHYTNTHRSVHSLVGFSEHQLNLTNYNTKKEVQLLDEKGRFPSRRSDETLIKR